MNTSLQVTPIPAFDDNYIWALHDDRAAVIVDPGDATPVAAFLQKERLSLAAILITHHHADHIGGVEALRLAHPAPWFAPEDERIAGAARRVRDGERIRLPHFDIDLTVIAVPGHTRSHVAYQGAGMLFCGDTLFAAGCGRLFEGTAQQMHESLSAFARLPDDTRVYCAHEYTLSNIRFARAADPENAALLRFESQARAQRENGIPTLPTTIGQEKAVNPFMRVSEPGVIAGASAHAGRTLTDPVSVLAEIREWKNNF
jgi:hydroxyacylglutathione hydrolase